jgi:anti-sigma B factor antagonist
VQLSVEQRDGVHVVHVGEAKLTYPVLSSFFAGVVEVVDGGARRVELDLAAVTFIDSAAIGCLIDIHHLLKDRSGAVRLRGLQPRVATMLTMAGVDRVLDVAKS